MILNVINSECEEGFDSGHLVWKSCQIPNSCHLIIQFDQSHLKHYYRIIIICAYIKLNHLKHYQTEWCSPLPGLFLWTSLDPACQSGLKYNVHHLCHHHRHSHREHIHLVTTLTEYSTPGSSWIASSSRRLASNSDMLIRPLPLRTWTRWRSWRGWLWPRWRWLQCWCWWWPPSTDVILGPESNLIVARPTSPPELLLLLKPDNVLIIITIMMKIVTMSMTMMRMMGSIMTMRPDRVWGENHAKTLTGVRVHQLWDLDLHWLFNLMLVMTNVTTVANVKYIHFLFHVGHAGGRQFGGAG